MAKPKPTPRERAIEKDAENIVRHLASMFTINANGERLLSLARNAAGENYDRNLRNYQRAKHKTI